MFNSFSNSFSYNINAVSGTLRKSHPKSRIIVSEIRSDLKIFNKKNPTLWMGNWDEQEIVILQIMLCGENKALVEFVEKKDFEEVAGETSKP